MIANMRLIPLLGFHPPNRTTLQYSSLAETNDFTNLCDNESTNGTLDQN